MVLAASASRSCPPSAPDATSALAAPMASTVFGAVARAVNDAARHEGLEPAAFRSPPGLRGTRRSVRRLGPETVLVAVTRGPRPAADVMADMVDGVLRANPAASADPDVRHRLLTAAHTALLATATPTP